VALDIVFLTKIHIALAVRQLTFGLNPNANQTETQVPITTSRAPRTKIREFGNAYCGLFIKPLAPPSDGFGFCLPY